MEELTELQDQNRCRFDLAVDRLCAEAPSQDSLSRVKDLVMYAQKSGCGLYASAQLENWLYAQADALPGNTERPVEPGHLLMVMSEAYCIGGHTRVVERWVEADRGRRYSLVLTRQGGCAKMPERLLRAIESSGGTVNFLSSESFCEQAQELRQLASGFEKVVLHIHTDDVVPLLAFGTERFPRPVAFYNHADHLFWLGVGLADGIAEIRGTGIPFSTERRGSTCSAFVGIPSDVRPVRRGDRAAARRALGLPEGVPVVVTCGNASKYEPVLGLDFMAGAVPIMLQVSDARLVGVGMTFRDFPAWKDVNARLGGRMTLMGPVSNDRLSVCFQAADLVLDSYPFGGGAALADALCCGTPVLSCPGPVGQMDWVYECAAHCETPEALVEKAVSVLLRRQDGAALAQDEYKTYHDINDISAFIGRVGDFLDSLGTVHRMRTFAPRFVGYSDLDRYHLTMNLREEPLFSAFGKRMRLYRQHTPTSRRKVLSVGPMTFSLGTKVHCRI